MRRVPLAALLHLPPRRPEPAPAPSAAQLLAARQGGGKAALEALQPRIDALEAALEEASHRHAAEMQQVRDLTLRLFAGLEQLLATELADLAHAAARAVLAAEPVLGQATLAALISDTVSGLSRGVLFVPPDALESARGLCPDGWSLQPDPSLADAVRVEAGAALRQQSLGNRLAALLEATR
jgi:hypothetical protein